MTGGSLEESKEALAIAETDGLLTIFIYIPLIFLFLAMNTLYMFLKMGFSPI